MGGDPLGSVNLLDRGVHSTQSELMFSGVVLNTMLKADTRWRSVGQEPTVHYIRINGPPFDLLERQDSGMQSSAAHPQVGITGTLHRPRTHAWIPREGGFHVGARVDYRSLARGIHAL